MQFWYNVPIMTHPKPVKPDLTENYTVLVWSDSNFSFQIDSSSAEADGGDLFTHLETESCRLILPFLRVASLIRHYVFQEHLPDIFDDSDEFDKLATFLKIKSADNVVMRDDTDMDDSSMSSMIVAPSSSKFVSTLTSLKWFTTGATELFVWLESFKSSIAMSNVDFVRKALKISLVWKQPKLLILPKNYDQIFQVIFRLVFCHCVLEQRQSNVIMSLK